MCTARAEVALAWIFLSISLNSLVTSSMYSDSHFRNRKSIHWRGVSDNCGVEEAGSHLHNVVTVSVIPNYGCLLGCVGEVNCVISDNHCLLDDDDL